MKNLIFVGSTFHFNERSSWHFFPYKIQMTNRKIAVVFHVKICKADVFIWGFWNFCFLFVSFGCFRFYRVLIIWALPSQSRFSKEDHDGRRCLYLPCCCSPGSPIVLRSIIRTYKKLMNGNHKERQSLPRLPTFQRSATSSWIYGSSRAVHLLGSRNSWRCHTRLYHSLLYNRFRCRIDNTRCFYLYGSCFNPL